MSTGVCSQLLWVPGLTGRCLCCLFVVLLLISCCPAAALSLPEEISIEPELPGKEEAANLRPGAAAAAATRDMLKTWWHEMQSLLDTTTEALRGAAQDIQLGTAHRKAGDFEERLKLAGQGAADLLGHFGDFLIESETEQTSHGGDGRAVQAGR